jgi:hypothetical protein
VSRSGIYNPYFDAVFCRKIILLYFSGRHDEGGFGGPPFGGGPGEGGEDKQGFGSFDSFDE